MIKEDELNSDNNQIVILKSLKDVKEKLDNDIKIYDSSVIEHESLNIPYLQERIIMPSFYRCGNTLTREIIEGVTNVITGSDDNHLKVNYTALGNKEVPQAFLNFKGNGVLQNNSWVYKTHYPARLGKCSYKFEKILLVVRNPFDALESMFNLFTTNSHTNSISDDMYTEYFDNWYKFVSSQINSYTNFYYYWLNLAFTNDIKIYIVKYEDLSNNQFEETVNIIKFMLNSKGLTDNIINKDILEYLKNRKILYIPRKGSSYHSFKYYTIDMFLNILNESYPLISFFGYDEYILELLNNIESVDFMNKGKISKTHLEEIEKYQRLLKDKCKELNKIRLFFSFFKA